MGDKDDLFDFFGMNECILEVTKELAQGIYYRSKGESLVPSAASARIARALLFGGEKSQVHYQLIKTLRALPAWWNALRT